MLITMVPIIYLFYYFHLVQVSSFVSKSHPLRSTVFQRFKNDQEKYVDEENYVVDDEISTWWEIFGHSNKYKSPVVEGESFTLPDVKIWRTACFDDDIVENESPPKLIEYFQGKSLGKNHEENIQGLWRQMKNRKSLKHLSEKNVWRVIEALRVAYISLWGLHTKRSLEVSINR